MPTIYGVPFRKVLGTLSLGEPNSVANDGGFLYQNIAFDLDPIASTDLLLLTLRPGRIFFRDDAGNNLPDFTDSFLSNGFFRLTGPGNVGSVNVPVSVFNTGGRWRDSDGGIDGYADWITRFLALEAGSRSLDIDFFDTDLPLDLGLNPPLTLKEYADLNAGLSLQFELDQPIAYTGTVRYADLAIVTSETASVSTFPSVSTPTIAVYWGRSVGSFGFNSIDILGSSNQIRFRNLRGSQAWKDNGDIIVSASSTSAVFPSPSDDGDVIYDIADYPDATQLFADLLAGSNPTTVDFRTNIVTPIELGLDLGTSSPEVSTPKVNAGTLGLDLGTSTPNAYIKRTAGELGLELGSSIPESRLGSIIAGTLRLELDTGTPESRIGSIPAGSLGLDFGITEAPQTISSDLETLTLELGVSSPNAYRKIAAGQLGIEFGFGPLEFDLVGVPDAPLGLDLGVHPPIGYKGTLREADFGSGLQETAVTISISEDDSDIDPDINTFYFEYNEFSVDGFLANLYSLYFDGISFDILLSTYPTAWQDNPVSVTIRNVHGDELTQSNISDITTISFSEDSTPGYTDFVRNVIGGTNYDLTVTFAYGSGSANELGLILSSPPVNHEIRYGAPREAILDLGVGQPTANLASVVAGSLGLDFDVGEPESRIGTIVAGALGLDFDVSEPVGTVTSVAAGELGLELSTDRPSSLLGTNAGTLGLDLSLSAPQFTLSSVGAGTLGLDLGLPNVIGYRRLSAGTLGLEFVTSAPNGYRKLSAGTLGLEFVTSAPNGYRKLSAGTLGLEFVTSTVSGITQRGAGELQLELGFSHPRVRLANVGAGNIQLDLGLPKANGFVRRAAGTLGLEFGTSTVSGIAHRAAGELALELSFQRPRGTLKSVAGGELGIELGTPSVVAYRTLAAGSLGLDLSLTAPIGSITSVAGGELGINLSFENPFGTITSVAAGTLTLALAGRFTSDVSAGELILDLGFGKPTGTITSTAGGALNLVFVSDKVSGIRKIKAGELFLVLHHGEPLVIRGTDIEPSVQRTQRRVRDSQFNRNFSTGIIDVPYNER